MKVTGYLGKSTYEIESRAMPSGDPERCVIVRRHHPDNRHPTEIHLPRELLFQWLAQQPHGEVMAAMAKGGRR